MKFLQLYFLEIAAIVLFCFIMKIEPKWVGSICCFLLGIVNTALIDKILKNSALAVLLNTITVVAIGVAVYLNHIL